MAGWGLAAATVVAVGPLRTLDGGDVVVAGVGAAAGAFAIAASRQGQGRFDPMAVLVQELERARRLGYRATLVRVDARSAESVASELRRIDVQWRVGEDHYVLMPDTDAETARNVLQRLGLDGAAGVATFPDDALTSTAMLESVLAPARLTQEAPVAADAVTDIVGDAKVAPVAQVHLPTRVAS